MPHLRFRGIEKAGVATLSENLAEILAIICQTTADNFTFEHIETTFMRAGVKDSGSPFVEVLWFERPANVKQSCADHLTTKIKQLTAAQDVTVIFTDIPKTNYFENAKHF